MGKLLDLVEREVALRQVVEDIVDVQEDAPALVQDRLYGGLGNGPGGETLQLLAEVGPQVLQVARIGGIEFVGLQCLERVHYGRFRTAGDHQPQPVRCSLPFAGEEGGQFVLGALGRLVQGIDDKQDLPLRSGEVPAQRLNDKAVEKRLRVRLGNKLLEIQSGESVPIFDELGTHLVGEREHAPPRIRLLHVTVTTEVEGRHFGPMLAELGGNGRLAYSRGAGDPEDPRGGRVAEPGADLLEDPLPAGEMGHVLRNIRVEGQRVQQFVQARLLALEVQLVAFQGAGELCDLRLVADMPPVQRHAVPHVQPLDAADRQRRLAPYHHDRHNRHAPTQGAGEFIQAVAVGPADRMRSQQQDHPADLRFGGHPVQPALDAGLPFLARQQPLLVEPDFVPASLQVLLHPPRKGRMFVVAVTEENAPGRRRLRIRGDHGSNRFRPDDRRGRGWPVR